MSEELNNNVTEETATAAPAAVDISSPDMRHHLHPMAATAERA